MIEIGKTLRQAREQRGLRLEDVARVTKISTRYLRAIENERFEALPAPFYARSCLREYADFLGLDSDRLVESYRERIHEPEQPLVLEAITPERRPRVSGWVGAALVAAAVTVLAVVAFRTTGTPSPQVAPAARSNHPATSVHHPTPTHRKPPRHLQRIVIAAARGDCWLLVRADSQDGQILYEGTLRRGNAIRFRKPRLWVRLGAPWNVHLRLDGHALDAQLAVGSEPRNILISRTGIRNA
jgi:transcriptional regulator with XRE-family HTH domain